MSNNNKLLLSEELALIEGLQSWSAPSFDAENLDLNSFVQNPDQDYKDAVAAAEHKTVAQGEQIGSAAPLTAIEAEVVDAKIDELLEGIAAARKRIADFDNEIDLQVAEAAESEGLVSTSGGGQSNDITFNVNLRKKRALRNAVKKMFGFAPDKLTYSMYKAALKAKRQLEKEQVEEYMDGDY
jgi:ribosomal protein L23